MHYTYLLEELWCYNLNKCFLIDKFEVSKQWIEAARRISAHHMLMVDIDAKDSTAYRQFTLGNCNSFLLSFSSVAFKNKLAIKR